MGLRLINCHPGTWEVFSLTNEHETKRQNMSEPLGRLSYSKDLTCVIRSRYWGVWLRFWLTKLAHKQLLIGLVCLKDLTCVPRGSLAFSFTSSAYALICEQENLCVPGNKLPEKWTALWETIFQGKWGISRTLSKLVNCVSPYSTKSKADCYRGVDILESLITLPLYTHSTWIWNPCR